MLRNYELTLILEPEIKSQEKEKLLQKLEKEINQKGKVKESKEWGKKQLAYSIKKQEAGIFYWLFFEADSPILLQLEKKLKQEDQIMRYLLVLAED